MVKMPHWPIPMGAKPVDLGLDRVRALLKALNNPHLKIPPVVHFAGTNGKGSSLAFLKAILIAAGYKVHTYTSPHLVRFNERINICGFEITDSLLYETIEEVRLAAESIDLKTTFFEGTTVAAFLAFSRVPADIVLMETGLGGRLDATNVIDHPLLTVITSISIDHTEFLGDHLSKIAYEKAGIMKRCVPCVVSNQYPDALAVLEKKALDLEIPLIEYEYDWGIEKTQDGFIYKSPSMRIEIDKISLAGEHQYINAGNAISAALALKDFNINIENIKKGIANAYWPARLQRLKEGTLVNYLPVGWELWVDGAHNAAGAHILSVWMDQQTLPIYIIAGITKGRDSKEFFSHFRGKVKLVAGVLVEAEPSSYPASYIAKTAREAGIDSIEADSIEDAIEKLISQTDEPSIVLVCGSLYLAGDFMFKNQGRR